MVLAAQKETEVAESFTAGTNTSELAKESVSSRMAKQPETLWKDKSKVVEWAEIINRHLKQMLVK